MINALFAVASNLSIYNITYVFSSNASPRDSPSIRRLLLIVVFHLLSSPLPSHITYLAEYHTYFSFVPSRNT
jgi:hypothetical protein